MSATQVASARRSALLHLENKTFKENLLYFSLFFYDAIFCI